MGGTEVVAPPRRVGPGQSVPSQAVPQTSSAGGDDVSKTSSASSEAPKGGVDTGSSTAVPSKNQTLDRQLGVSYVLLAVQWPCDYHMTVTCQSHDDY